VIRRDRNPKGVKIDRTTKGVQIRIAQLLKTRFGTTGRTATTLAEVALGLEPGALSERTARSALKPGETAH
jgi:hypothetical protein